MAVKKNVNSRRGPVLFLPLSDKNKIATVSSGEINMGGKNVHIATGGDFHLTAEVIAGDW